MATPFFSRSALGPQVTHDSSVISMWRWTLYINPSAKLAGSAFKGQPQSDPLTRLSERSGSGSLPTLPAPALPVARSVHSGPLRKKSVRVTPPHTVQNPPVTPSDLDAATACDSHEVCPGSSPARSPDLLAFPETSRPAPAPVCRCCTSLGVILFKHHAFTRLFLQGSA